MSEGIQTALTLLAVGMITVFAILTLVVIGGKVLIALVHRFSNGGEEIVTSIDKTNDEVPVAIISAVVQHITQGRGKVTRIDKID